MSGRTFKVLASIIVVVGAASYLLADTLFADPEALTYFHPSDEVIAQKDTFIGKNIRMGGIVQKASIFQNKGTLEYQFSVLPVAEMLKHPEYAKTPVTVRYRGIVPDTFKDEAHVIVTGSLDPEGVFQANDLLAKCPSKYEAQMKTKGTY